MNGEHLLAVRDLGVTYRGARAVEGATFHIDAGEAVGVLGESGCGKTSLALAIPGMLPVGGRVAAGSIRWRGRELSGAPERELAALRGAEIALIFQEPALALNPVMRVGAQICEVVRAHRRWTGRQVREHAAGVLGRLCPRDAARIFDAYPHQLSGGQRQRVAIAQAVALGPALIVADEPTSALDPTVQAEILTVFRELKQAGSALLLVTHHPATLTALADRVLVMYAGAIVEQGAFREVAVAPRHPYTRALLACLPRLNGPGHHLPDAIPGAPPNAAEPLPGCAFAPRCAERTAVCVSGTPPGEAVRCFHHAA